MKKTYTKKQITEAIAYWEKQLKRMNESDAKYGHSSDGNFYGYMNKPLKILFSDTKPNIKIMITDQEDSKYSFITEVIFEYKKDIENSLTDSSGCKCEVVSLEKDHYDYEYIAGLNVDDINKFKTFASANLTVV